MSKQPIHLLSELPRLIYQINNSKIVESQCDCACASTISAHLPPLDFAADKPYSVFRGCQPVALDTTHAAMLLKHSSRLVVLNQPALAIINHFTQLRPFSDIPPAWYEMWGDQVVQATLKDMITIGLLVPEGDTTSFIENPTTLNAWLHITDRCNLRCSYCYLPHHRVDMSLETGRAAIDATVRSAIAHNFQGLKLKYAGGEATLRFQFVAKLQAYAQIQTQQYNLKLDGVVLSNGTCLTSKIIKQMQMLSLRLMISLDGLGHHHDRQRSYADGRGSFTRVAQAIDLALDHSLTPDISVTVSGGNVKELPVLLEWLLERDLPFSLNFYRENDYSKSVADLKLEEEEMINGMLAAFKVIEAELPRRSLLASLVDRANLSTPHLRTCSVSDSYLVFDHLGQVSKCQMNMNQPITNFRAEDPLALIRADQVGIQNISVEEKESCRDCEWKYWCTGGCPLATYRATGRYDVKSPNCNIYKALYPEVVRLEGLRLLKYMNESIEMAV